MNFILDIIRGAVIGIANIIPGVSGGTMMVTMGIYDKLIGSITGIVKNFKKSIKTLFPYIIGMAVGIGAFAFLLTKVLLVKAPLPTAFAFIGLIVGGVPVLVKKAVQAGSKNATECEVTEGVTETTSENAKAEKTAAGSTTTKKPHLALCILIFALFFALIIGMQFMGEGADKSVTFSVGTVLVMVIMGVLAAAAMVIPGVSGSLLLLAFGYYNAVTGAVTDFISAVFDFDIPTAWDKFLILFPFGIGVLLGIFFVAKLIEWLLKKHERLTYCGILGLVCASPIPVFMNALGGAIGAVAVIASVITFGAGFAVAYVMGRE
ncbi:MAG: DUF368 domain-containing protein [Lachnospiraceae bacterium]|nr:DUF368 domain-containing protein [Lachnospiraceae bacterium]